MLEYKNQLVKIMRKVFHLKKKEIKNRDMSNCPEEQKENFTISLRFVIFNHQSIENKSKLKG